MLNQLIKQNERVNSNCIFKKWSCISCRYIQNQKGISSPKAKRERQRQWTLNYHRCTRFVSWLERRLFLGRYGKGLHSCTLELEQDYVLSPYIACIQLILETWNGKQHIHTHLLYIPTLYTIIIRCSLNSIVIFFGIVIAARYFVSFFGILKWQEGIKLFRYWNFHEIFKMDYFSI